MNKYNIIKKAYIESKKKMQNLANYNDIIEISIINNKVILTKKSCPKFKSRQNDVVRFLKEVRQLSYKDIDLKEFLLKIPSDNDELSDKLKNDSSILTNLNITMSIGLHDSYHEDLGIMVFSLKNKNQNNIVIPDLYAMKNYDCKLKYKDKIKIKDKVK